MLISCRDEKPIEVCAMGMEIYYIGQRIRTRRVDFWLKIGLWQNLKQ